MKSSKSLQLIDDKNEKGPLQLVMYEQFVT